MARELLDEVPGTAQIPPQVNASLSLEYVRLDRTPAEHVIGAARQALSQLAVGETGVPLDAEGIVEIAGRAAYLYQLDSAVDLLLDAAVAVGQPRHLRRGDPVREIERLVQEFHPEVPRQVAIRQQVARRTRSWLAQAPADPARLGVTAAVMQIVLSLRLRSAMSHPGRPDELHLIDTIAPADEIRHISGEIWPSLNRYSAVRAQDWLPQL